MRVYDKGHIPNNGGKDEITKFGNNCPGISWKIQVDPDSLQIMNSNCI